MKGEFYSLQGSGWTRPHLAPGVVTPPPVITPPPPPPDNPPPTDDLPNLTEIAWSSLNPVAGEHMGTTLHRQTVTARVVMPAVTVNIIDDADTNQYDVFAPKAIGIRGAGIGKTVAQVKAHTYTNKTVAPGSAGNGVLRFGPNGGSTRVQTSLSDMSFIGADQLDNAGNQMLYAGLLNYYGQDAVWQDVKLLAMSRGGGNSPATGETFAINSFHDINSRYIRVEVDGRSADLSQRIGGSPFGCNGSKNVYLEDCYLHDSAFSGVTFSVAGSTASPTDTITTLRLKVAQNANHTAQKVSSGASGWRFAGINMEFCVGQITHTLADISLDPDTINLWDSVHAKIYETVADNPTILFDNPNWHGQSPPWANGAFTVGLAGVQVTPPAVKNSDGSLKTPVIVVGQNPPHQSINPATQYACNVGTGYVAP